MDKNLPEPFVPAEVDLRDYSWMPLEVATLRDSGAAAKLDGDVFKAAVLAWCAAWHQVPASSLPDDDEELSNMLGFGRMPFAIKEWQRLRAAGALRGFVKCADGRLYHRKVAEKAREAWEQKLKASRRGRAGAEARWGGDGTSTGGDMPQASGSDAQGTLRRRRKQTKPMAQASDDHGGGNASSIEKHATRPDQTRTERGKPPDPPGQRGFTPTPQGTETGAARAPVQRDGGAPGARAPRSAEDDTEAKRAAASAILAQFRVGKHWDPPEHILRIGQGLLASDRAVREVMEVIEAQCARCAPAIAALAKATLISIEPVVVRTETHSDAQMLLDTIAQPLTELFERDVIFTADETALRASGTG